MARITPEMLRGVTRLGRRLVRRRPLLHTSYESDQAIFPTSTARLAFVLLLVGALSLPFQVVPGLRWAGEPIWLAGFGEAMILAIAALGLNLLTGVAGQLSLGHALFMGVGAYGAVVLGGDQAGNLVGLGLPMWVWLPAGGLVAALVGLAVSPVAVRVRGIPLAFVTLALVFIGGHVFRNAPSVSGGSGLGREWPGLELRLWKEQTPLVDFSSSAPLLGIGVGPEGKVFFLLLLLLGVFSLVHRNIIRTRPGRALAAIRDHELAARVMGVDELRYKALAFGLSSFFAGVSGALLASHLGSRTPETWDVLLSVEMVAIVVIGGAGSTAGVIAAAFLAVSIPRTVEMLTGRLADLADSGGPAGAVVDALVSTGPDDFGLVGTAAAGPGLSAAQLGLVLYGSFIVAVLLVEPRGLHGIWMRVRDYWRGFPFTPTR